MGESNQELVLTYNGKTRTVILPSNFWNLTADTIETAINPEAKEFWYRFHSHDLVGNADDYRIYQEECPPGTPAVDSLGRMTTERHRLLKRLGRDFDFLSEELYTEPTAEEIEIDEYNAIEYSGA